MAQIRRWLKIALLDTLGVACIVIAPLMGWLPGPGGVPLLILGLSLLAVHHEWAQRYIDFLRKYADRIGDKIFLANPRLQLLYDIAAPLLLAVGILLFVRKDSLWMASAGMVAIIGALLFFFGNRQRGRRLKERFLKFMRRPQA